MRYSPKEDRGTELQYSLFTQKQYKAKGTLFKDEFLGAFNVSHHFPRECAEDSSGLVHGRRGCGSPSAHPRGGVGL